MITSAANAQVKHIIQLNQKAKARREHGLFVAEGRKMFREAPRSWIRKVYLSSGVTLDEEWESALMGLPYEIVEERVFRQMSDTKTPQGVLTLLKIPTYTLEEICSSRLPLLLLLEDLQDPGNVGTILRTAEGAGVDGVLVTSHTADLFQPKVIRATMGSIYRMPFYQLDDMGEAVTQLKNRGIHSYAAHLQGENSYDQEDYTKGTIFFIGNEGNGLSEALTNRADRLIHIPMAGKVESLNAAMAAGILMYEAARQRR